MRGSLPLFLATALVAGVGAQGGPPLVLNSCSASSAAVQQWTFNKPGNMNFALSASVSKTPVMCMDIEEFDKQSGATVWTWPCG